MEVSWTTEQQQVISLRGRNILVSAAAGSGKTAVLVERIIGRLTEEKNPIDVDHLLVVTYTEAAAAEMKERIRSAIEKQLEQHPDDLHLQRQASLIHNAPITTIHSFCLSVIRDHFHVIDLDPGFRIAEEGELKLLKHDVLQTLLENHYAEGTEQFLEFVECFATGRDDKKIEELLLQLYEFSRSYPEPKVWLENCNLAYELNDIEALEASDFMKWIKMNINFYLEDALLKLQSAMDACMELDGPLMYLAALQADELLINHLEQACNLEELYKKGNKIKWERLASNRDKSVSLELTEFVKNTRSEVKEIIGNISEQYLYQEPEELRKDMIRSKKIVQTLTSLVNQFAKAFEEEKKSKNMIDFGDMEQFALRILKNSDIAKGYQKQFVEVMIDEYQDSNLIQEAILNSVSTTDSGVYNVFMVGDVKQSIYRFRLSRPELFMEKFNTYSLTDGEKQRIDLHKNFRSRREVLDTTNSIFQQIMTKRLGGITYDDRAALYVGADYEEQPDNETEILLVSTKTYTEEELEVEDTVRELEARATARRIKELVKTGKVRDKKTGEYRIARYSDIVILTRSLKGWTDVFSDILNREGIPTYTGSKEGYFDVTEVALLLDYLRVLDNPRQDLPLTAVLRSMFCNLTNEELAEIKSTYANIAFHEAVWEYAKDKIEESAEKKNVLLQRKLQHFMEQIEVYRKKVPYTAIHELLWQIIGNTGYGDYVLAVPGGEQRKANIDMLVEKAMAFETTSYKGLFNFIRYIEQLKKYDVDYGEANVADEQADTVRLMSIHKSKGLEFPIVFVAGMSKRFNTQDAKGSVVIHPELGIGVDQIDLLHRTKVPTILKKAIQKQIVLENLGEELRVLYVALTRAKEKLIMVGTVSDFEKKLSGLNITKNQKELELTFSTLAKANTYYDWVLPALIRNKAFSNILEAYDMTVPFTNELYNKEIPVQIKYIQLEELITAEIKEELEGLSTKELLEAVNSEAVYDEGIKEQLNQQFSFTYPYESEQQYKLKFTVSELKKRAYLEEEAGELLHNEPEVIPLLPKFLAKDEKVQGAFRGTAYHRVMELLDFSRDYTLEMIQALIQEDISSGMLTGEMASSIDMEDILNFLNSPIGKRMKNASRTNALFVEQPFVLGVPAQEIYHEESDEMVLVQGIIDVYFEEDNKELVVLDYKTDKVHNIGELGLRYKAQLEYYAKALEQLTGKKVKEKLIYSFTLQELLQI